MSPNFAGLLALALAIGTATALTCYKCDSQTTSLCNYGGVSSITYSAVDCNEEGNSFTNWWGKECVKIVATGKDGKEYIARGCAPSSGGLCDALVKTAGFFSDVELAKTSCHTCDTDKCNSAEKLKSFTFLALIVGIFLFMF